MAIENQILSSLEKNIDGDEIFKQREEKGKRIAVDFDGGDDDDDNGDASWSERKMQYEDMAVQIALDGLSS